MAARMTALPREKSRQAPLCYHRPVPPGGAPCVPRSAYSTLSPPSYPRPALHSVSWLGWQGGPQGRHTPHPCSQICWR